MKAENYSQIDALILAGGKSTRMGGTIPKVLLDLGNKKVIDYTLELTLKLECNKVGVVVGFRAEDIINYINNKDITFVEQKEQLGTGHAVKMSKDQFSGDGNQLLVINGDVPLLSLATLQNMKALHAQKQPCVTVLTTHLDNPFGYGRVVRSSDNKILKVIEENKQE